MPRRNHRRGRPQASKRLRAWLKLETDGNRPRGVKA